MHHDLLMDAVERLLADCCTPDVVSTAEGGMAESLWRTLEDAGLTLMALPERAGGGGADLHDAMAVLRSTGRHAAPVPLAETGLIAAFALAEAGLDVPAGPLACVWAADGDGRLSVEPCAGGWRVVGDVPSVAFASVASRLVVVAHDAVLSLPTSEARIEPGANLAGEPRDRVILDAVVDGAVAAPPSAASELLELRAALCRAVQLAGALERALELSVVYANERVQFGRPLGRFQAVQQLLAELAGEAAAGEAAAQLAVDAVAAAGLPAAADAVAIAKLRTSEAAGRAAQIAHQVHGAIGMTREHPLHHTTRRLWAWRDEHGNEAAWATWLGDLVVLGGADALWPELTRA